MAHEKFCVADSGGTSTTWIFIDGKSRSTHCTIGLPPRSLFGNSETLREVVEQLPDIKTFKLYFYGTGLSSLESSSIMKNLLLDAGFEDVEVYSDVLAACRASLADEIGTVAILGTGSVVAEYDGRSVSELRGGLGPFLGDEGSGYYFGRLVLHDYYNGFLSKGQQALVTIALEEHAANKKFLALPDAPGIIAGLSSKLTEQDFLQYHIRNLEEFIRIHFVRRPPHERTLQVVGGYGSGMHELLQDLFERKNWSLGQVIGNPTENLVKYHAEKIEKNEMLNN